MQDSSWKIEFRRELERAQLARSDGNEGMARVCARRSAAIVIGEYLRQRGYGEVRPSVYERLSLFNALPDVDDELKEVCHHFLMKVNTMHKLPIQVDLIQEAIWLQKSLLDQEID
jgi:hypothetical protein